MNTPSIEDEKFLINKEEADILIDKLRRIAEEIEQEKALPGETLSDLSNLLFVFQDFEKFEVRPSVEQLRALYTAQQRILNNLRPGDLPNFVLTLLVTIGTLVEAEIGRYRIISALDKRK